MSTDQADPDFGRNNRSTLHQKEGDARLPSDTLDRGQSPSTDHNVTQPRPNLSTEPRSIREGADKGHDEGAEGEPI